MIIQFCYNQWPRQVLLCNTVQLYIFFIQQTAVVNISLSRWILNLVLYIFYLLLTICRNKTPRQNNKRVSETSGYLHYINIYKNLLVLHLELPVMENHRDAGCFWSQDEMQDTEQPQTSECHHRSHTSQHEACSSHVSDHMDDCGFSQKRQTHNKKRARSSTESFVSLWPKYSFRGFSSLKKKKKETQCCEKQLRSGTGSE